MSDNFNFLNVPREFGRKQSNFERIKNFKEVYVDFTASQASQQASRCLDCGNPYCQWQCPVNNYIPDWCKLVEEGRLFEAVEMCHRTNPLPEVCGRVCPQEKLCEGNCTLHQDFGAVTIGELEKYITDTAFKRGWRPDLSNVPQINKAVAIIGAGPAGLACAYVLRSNGFKVTVYDRYPQIGGLLTFGIPAFKLDKSVMTMRREILDGMGIQFVLNTHVGSDIDFKEILDTHDAVFLGLGAYAALTADIPGENLPDVHPALDYLIANNRQQLALTSLTDVNVNFKDEDVVILGGGDTAMDCTRTAIRHGAHRVACLYRRDEDNMPGSRKDFNNAKEEGVEFVWQKQPIEIISQNGKITHVKTLDSKLGETDKDGRKMPIIVPGTESLIKATKVVVAFGFNPQPQAWFAPHDIKTDLLGRVIVSNPIYPFRCANRKVFAGGDLVRGADLVVTAVYEGRESAHSISRYLTRAHG